MANNESSIDALPQRCMTEANVFRTVVPSASSGVSCENNSFHNNKFQCFQLTKL